MKEIIIRVGAAPPAKDGGKSIRSRDHRDYALVVALREAMAKTMATQDAFEGVPVAMELRVVRARCRADGLNLINGVSDVIQRRCNTPDYAHDVWVLDDDANVREFHYYEEPGDRDSYQVTVRQIGR